MHSKTWSSSAAEDLGELLDAVERDDAELVRLAAAELREIDPDHRVDALREQHLRDVEPDGAEPEDERGLPGARARAADAVDRDGERLDRRAVLEGQLVRQQVRVHADGRVRDADTVGEGTGDAEPDPRLVHMLAEMTETLAAAAACAAGLDRDARDAVADGDARDVVADGHDLAGELVPEHLADLDERALEVRVQVRPADAARLHLEHDVARARDGLGSLFHRDLSYAAIDADAHAASLRDDDPAG